MFPGSKLAICIFLCVALMLKNNLVNSFNMSPKLFLNSKNLIMNKSIINLKMAGDITELGFDSPSESEDISKTDLELGKSHGYEGDYKIGDKVRVIADIRLWHVKEYAKDGFICKGFEGLCVDKITKNL